MLFKNITTVDANTIKILITKSATEHTKIKNLYERYKQTQQGVPINTREYIIDGVKQTDKINNKIAVDMFGESINFKIGFFCGNPITYTLDKTQYQQEKNVASKTIDKVKSIFTKKELQTETVTIPKYEKDLQVINDFNKLNSIADLDLETSKRASICGYCGRLPYIETLDKKPVEKIKLVEPWECIFVGDTIEKPDYTIRYYDTITYESDGTEKKTSKAELYSAIKIQFFTKNAEGTYVQDSEIPHYWGRDPLIGFANNDETMGDIGDSGLSIIDDYDRTVSDRSSENGQTRLSYMKFKNCSITSEEIKKAKQTGAFSLPGEDADVDFIIKNVNDAAIENHLTRLKNDFYRTTGFPNMDDISFGGNLTGVAMKYKFRPFEDKCKRSELKFKKSFQSQFELLCKVWAEKGLVIDPMTIDYVFTRNYPQNLVEEVNMIRDGKGSVSQETLFSLVSFIPDPQKEKEKLDKENQEGLDEFIARNEYLSKTKKDEDENNVDKNNTDDKTKQSISNEVKE